MRINHLWLDQFKNLKDFEINFANHLTSMVIGGNGTGKSNLLEALAIIFRDLDLERTGNLTFEYKLSYTCRGRLVEVDANPSENGPITDLQDELIQMTLIDNIEPSLRKKRRSRLQFKVDGQEMTMTHFFRDKQKYLPTHVFGYYSGPTNRLAQHFEQHQRKFYDEQRAGTDNPLRPLFFALPVHSQFVLLAYFSFPDQEGLDFLKEYLGITDLESVLFIIRQPDWVRSVDREDMFWGATGIPRQFLDDLYELALAPMKTKVTRSTSTGKREDLELWNLYIKDVETLRNIAIRRDDNQNFFKALDTLYISRLIDEVRVRVKRIGVDGFITFPELSEGEQQLLTVLGLLKFTKNTESLFLLDEPDTHLNPAWKLKYMNLIEPIVGNDTQCQILLATHDPLVIGSCVKEQVRVLTFEDNDRSNPIQWHEPERDPRGMGPAALLTSDVYGLRSSLDLETQEKLDKKRHLAGKAELTEEDEFELQRLTSELSDLDFTYTIRDPLYQLFVKAMSEEYDAHPELKKPILSKEEQELQASLASEIARKIRKQRTGVVEE